MICVIYLLLSLFFTEEYTFCIKTAGIVMAKLLFEFPVRVHCQPNNTAENNIDLAKSTALFYNKI